MDEGLQPYRDAIANGVHTICLDRNLDPASSVNTEAGCRIEQFLPQLVEVARAVEPQDLDAFSAAFERDICGQCGHLDAVGTCAVREQAACCLYRYLPLIYDAIRSVERGSS